MKKYKKDIFRYYGRYSESFKEKIDRPNGLKYMMLFRKVNESSSKIFRFIYKIKLKHISKKTFIQIPIGTKIGDGLYIGHNGPIVINPRAVIGKNCNIAVGVTIGQENRGKRYGVPHISDEVWIGANAVLVGNIKIENDVLIAPNSFVNFDVPSHSIVIGNPAKIIYKEKATENYINRKI